MGSIVLQLQSDHYKWQWAICNVLVLVYNISPKLQIILTGGI